MKREEISRRKRDQCGRLFGGRWGGREGERVQMVYRVGGKSGDRATPRHAGKIGVPQMRLNGGDATAPWLLHFLLPRTLPRCWRLER